MEAPAVLLCLYLYPFSKLIDFLIPILLRSAHQFFVCFLIPVFRYPSAASAAFRAMTSELRRVHLSFFKSLEKQGL